MGPVHCVDAEEHWLCMVGKAAVLHFLGGSSAESHIAQGYVVAAGRLHKADLCACLAQGDF